MAALMRVRSIFVLTHDSIGLGEDGPTHQAIEHVASLRLIPNLRVWRPCDTVETAVAWQQAINYQGPSVLALSRQTLPHQARNESQMSNIEKGGYVLWQQQNVVTLQIIATGSEIALAVEAAEALAKENIAAKVISMPEMEVFAGQSTAYQNSVLDPNVATMAIEAGSGGLWRQYVRCKDGIISMDHFGASAPGDVLFKHFGFHLEHVVAQAQKVLSYHQQQITIGESQ